MLMDLAGFIFAAGFMAFVFSYVYRRLESWGIRLIAVNAGDKWTLRLSGVALIVTSYALFSYSLSIPMTFAVPAPLPDIEPMSYAEPEPASEPEPEPVTYLKEPVEEWLSLMDDAYYADAWSRSAQKLQYSLSASEFTRLAEHRRKPLGNVVGRVPVATVELSSLPDGREGAFKLHIYKTRFASGAEVEETVVEEAESDQWKILNYNLSQLSSR